jgi:preprotein translocase subunit SecF
MSNLLPFNLRDPRIKSRSSSRASRKMVVALLVALIITVMVVWFGFLGWGVIEMVRALASLISDLWIEFV